MDFTFNAFMSFAIVVLVSAPMAIQAQSKKDRNQARISMEAADRFFQQKNYRAAADGYGESIQRVPNNPYAHYRKGFAHFNLNENDLALNEFSVALSQGFSPLEVYRVRAFIYYQQQNYDEAIDDIQKGIALAPRDLPFLKALGEIYFAKKEYNEALSAFQRAASVAPSDADIDYNLARIYFANGNTRSQSTSAAAALTKGTRLPGETHFLLGDAYQKLGNVPGSIDEYKKAINSKPDIYQAYRNLAEVYRNENRFNDAIEISKQGLKMFPQNGGIYTDLSWYYSQADRADDAVQAAKAAVSLSSKEYMGYTNLCRAYNDTKKYDLAIAACNGALGLQPGDGETYFYLARAYNLTGRTAEATKLYGRAVAGLIEYTNSLPDYSDGWYLLGNAYFADNQRDKAIDAYLKCLALSPKFTKARYNLAIIYTRKKNRAAAMEQYDRLVPLDTKLAAALRSEIDRM
ncbi:MAG: tetratricopeptide repeat protein [Pyrinomonadaceae bacterium]